MADVLVADLEGNGLLPTLSKIWIISIGDPQTGEIKSYSDTDKALDGSLQDAVDRLHSADKTVWHHGLGYDVPAIREILDPGFPVEGVIDTLVLSKLENPDRPGARPHALETWGHRLGVHKVPDVDWTQWSPQMVPRCETDVRITMLLWQKLKYLLVKQPVAVEIEHQTAWEATNMIHRGMRLDVPYTRDLLGKFMDENEWRREQLQEIFPPILVTTKPSDPVKTLKVVNKKHPLRGKLEPGQPFCPLKVEEFNPGSREQIAARLIKRYGWEPTVFTDGGAPKVDRDILNDLTYPEAEPLKDYLDMEKSISQINSKIKKDGSGGGWLHHVTFQDRVHAGLNPLGTVTGRPSCSSPNVQQVSTSPGMRDCWIPSDGRVMVGVDASGLELRCLAHYMARYDNGAYGEEILRGDIHTKVMELWGFYDRNQTKRGEYGWLYGAGDPKLGLIATQDAHKAGQPCRVPGGTLRAKGAWMRRTMLEGIEGLGDLIEAVKARAATGRMVGIDGRNLWIRSDHSALNTLLQSAGAIIVKRALTYVPPALEAEGLNQGTVQYGPNKTWHLDPDVDAAMIMWVHDEIQLEAKPEVAERVGDIVIDCMRRAGEDLGFRLPIDGEKKIGMSWAETH